MRKYNNLEEVMTNLTLYKNASNGFDKWNDMLNEAAAILKLFNISWEFKWNGEYERWEAKLK